MTVTRPPADTSPPPPPAPPWTPASEGPRGWTALRITSVVFGSLMILVSVGMFAATAAGLWEKTHSQGGYLTTDTRTLTTPGYALASDRVELVASGTFLGTVRLRATASRPDTAVFVGIAPADAAYRYLSGVEYTAVHDYAFDSGPNVLHAGGRVATPPGTAGIWTASKSGTGTQELVWPVRDGQWAIVVMNADGSQGVRAAVDVGATFPSLVWIAVGVLVGGVVLLAGGLALVIVPVRRASRSG